MNCVRCGRALTPVEHHYYGGTCEECEGLIFYEDEDDEEQIMENQHRLIKGYRELNETEIGLMNEIKTFGPRMEEIVNKVKRHIQSQYDSATMMSEERIGLGETSSTELTRMENAEPERWVRMAKDHLQQGLMALTRAVAQPDFF